MHEMWADICGFEGRYQISTHGRVKSLPFLQRYLLRDGREALRRTGERTLAQQFINRGYAIVHLHLDSVRTAALVHRLVALTFIPEIAGRDEVNHIDGNKRNNNVNNLEWTTRSGNLLHAVATGLNTQAIPTAGYPSITQAARALHRRASSVRRL